MFQGHQFSELLWFDFCSFDLFWRDSNGVRVEVESLFDNDTITEFPHIFSVLCVWLSM